MLEQLEEDFFPGGIVADILAICASEISNDAFGKELHESRFTLAFTLLSERGVKTRQVDTHLVVFMRDDAANVEIERNERCFTGAIDAFLFLANLSV